MDKDNVRKFWRLDLLLSSATPC